MSERITISVPEDTLERLNDRMEYGDSRSAWITEAIEEKLEREAPEEGNQKAAPMPAD